MFEYLKRQIRSHVFLAFFLVTVFLNYLPDIAPYYTQVISGGEGEVIGTLHSFSEPCFEAPEGEWLCRAQYRIPFEKIRGKEAIGFGVIIFSTEISCADDQAKKVVLTPRGNDGVTTNFLKNYLTFSLDRLNCRSDLVVRVWARPTNGRYGFVQAAAFVGSEVAVQKCKRIVEYAISELLTFESSIFVLFYVVFGTLSRITGLSLEFPPFGRFKYFWLAFIISTSGVLFEILLPIAFPLYVTTKISSFFGLMVISGPILDFMIHSEAAGPRAKKVGKVLLRPGLMGLLPLIMMNLGLMGLSYYVYLYPYCILIWSLICLGLASYPFNAMMFFFGIAIFSDSLKIFMVPYLPGSRLTVTYMVFILLFEIGKRISALEKQARFEAGTEIAIGVAHDIRSPLTALRVSLSDLRGDSAEIARDAIQRIKGIADSLLENSRGSIVQASSISRVDLNLLIRNVATEFLIRFPERASSLEFITSEIEIYCRIDQIEFQRMITNLLNNSVEASASTDPICIQTRIERGNAFISIYDNGRGFSQEILDTFEFANITSKRTSSAGFGLGLAHAKKTIRRWGGKLKIISSPGQGSEVQIFIPIR